LRRSLRWTVLRGSLHRVNRRKPEKAPVRRVPPQRAHRSAFCVTKVPRSSYTGGFAGAGGESVCGDFRRPDLPWNCTHPSCPRCPCTTSASCRNHFPVPTIRPGKPEGPISASSNGSGWRRDFGARQGAATQATLRSRLSRSGDAVPNQPARTYNPPLQPFVLRGKNLG